MSNTESTPTTDTNPTAYQSNLKQYATFYVGDLLFGVDVMHVQELIRYQEMTEVPLAAKEIEGLINLRGEIIAAIDLRRRLSMEPRAEDAEPPMNVVLRTDDGIISLLVDDIGDVMEVNKTQFENTPDTIDEHYHEMISGVFKLEDTLLLILNTNEVVNVNVDHDA